MIHDTPRRRRLSHWPLIRQAQLPIIEQLRQSARLILLPFAPLQLVNSGARLLNPSMCLIQLSHEEIDAVIAAVRAGTRDQFLVDLDSDPRTRLLQQAFRENDAVVAAVRAGTRDRVCVDLDCVLVAVEAVK